MIYRRGLKGRYWIRFQSGGRFIHESTGTTVKALALDIEAERRIVEREHQKRAKQIGCDSRDVRPCPECENLFDETKPVESSDGAKVCGEQCREKRDKRLSPIPTFTEFCTTRFEPWAKATFEHTTPKSWQWFRTEIRALCAFKPLADSRMNKITAELAAEFSADRLSKGMQVATANSGLRVLRRILTLAVEWGVIESRPKVKRLPGERHRDRVISPAEEFRYLTAAPEPLASIAAVLTDTGMRPDECYRLSWDAITWASGRHGILQVKYGKTAAARRVLPMTPRVRFVLETRWEAAGKPETGFVWPANTRTGHAENSTIRKHHACTFQTIAKEAKKNNQKPVRPFVLYSLRHTFLTRLGESGCDVWTLARIAGHSTIGISSRYVHPSDDAILSAMAKMAPVEKDVYQKPYQIPLEQTPPSAKLLQ